MVNRRPARPIGSIASVGVAALLAVVPLVAAATTAAAEPTSTTAEPTSTVAEPTTTLPDATTEGESGPAITDGAQGEASDSLPSPNPSDAPDATDASEPPVPADADRIQVVGIEETADTVILELAVPPAIGELAPVAANFGVTDGGQRVEFAVAPVATATDTVMVLDTSGSMQGTALAAAKSAAVTFIQALPDDARVGLIGFDDRVITYRTPTLDRAGLLADIEGLTATGQETLLWDALLVAADMAADSAADHSSIVVLSDGDDTASGAAPVDVVARLEAGSTALYAVAIESPDTDLVALEETVDLVGGQFLATSDIGQLESLYTGIAGRLRNRYRLSFTPAHQGRRTVVVSVAAGSSVATARITLGDGDGGQAAGGGPDGSSSGEDELPPAVDGGQEPALVTVVSPAAGRFAGPTLLAVGLGSMFAALTIVGLILVRPAARVRLDTAAGVDRLGGISTRLGEAADELIARHDRGSLIDTRLEAAAVNLRPGEFVLVWFLLAGTFGVTAAAFAGLTAGALALVASVVAGLLFLRVRTSRRRSDFADQLTETLGIIAGSLRSGQSLPASFELVAAEAPSPTADEFHRIAFEVRVGRDLTESIRDAARRMASTDLEWVAQAVDINRELGGDLSEIMDNVAATIRERRTVARQIAALSAEGRTTGWVLLAMPIILFVVAWWRTPDRMATFVAEPTGRLLLVVAVTGMAVGHLWIRHLVKLKY